MLLFLYLVISPLSLWNSCSRLEKLGANRIYERVDCDIDFEDNYEDWAQGVLEVLGTLI